MIKLQGSIPRRIGIAVSGGVDSMVALDFLRRNHDITVYHVNHGTEYGNRAMPLVVDYCHKHHLPFHIHFVQDPKPKEHSWEEFWRDQRYGFFSTFNQNIVLAHHLDDCVETYVFNLCHGKAYTMPYRAKLAQNCFRPFRLNRKQEFLKWAEKHSVPYLDDPTNTDASSNLIRTKIRTNLIPQILDINPGIYKVVSKVIEDEMADNQD